MGRQTYDPARLLETRNRVIRHLYGNAPHQRDFSMKTEDLMLALGISKSEMNDVITLMTNQGLFAAPGLKDVGLSQRGQEEAEKLNPPVPLREPQPSSGITINASYSVVQVAGSHSEQSATLQVNRDQVEQILDDIRQELPSLSLPQESKDEASGLIQSLRDNTAAGLKEAGIRAIGGALLSLLKQGGSSCWHRLAEVLNISV